MSEETDALEQIWNDEEVQQLRNFFGENPLPEEKQGLFHFLSKVLKTRDTKKVSNLDLNEVNAIRILEDVANYARIMRNKNMESYFRSQSEIVLATALSKKGFLIDKAVTAKKETTLRSGSQTGEKSRWFRKNVQE